MSLSHECCCPMCAAAIRALCEELRDVMERSGSTMTLREALSLAASQNAREGIDTAATATVIEIIDDGCATVGSDVLDRPMGRV